MVRARWAVHELVPGVEVNDLVVGHDKGLVADAPTRVHHRHAGQLVTLRVEFPSEARLD